MAEIFALVEHRQGAVRDITYELLTCGRKLATAQNTKLTALVFASPADKIVESIQERADRIIVMEHGVFENFNAEIYQLALRDILEKEKPHVTLIGHTAFGYDLCPALGAEMGIPFATDCLDIEFTGSRLRVTRSVYDGKLDAHVLLKEHTSYLVTLRSGCFTPEEVSLATEVVKQESPVTEQPEYRKFVDYIEAAVGEVDITKADIIVSVGRGIKEQANLPVMEEFATAIGGVLSCSRPVVDAGWLPKDRQVGSSGKTVKPKLYIALGISGAFQHIVGMKGADTIIAVNKDPNAPIFNEADYGIVEDLFKVVPVLKEKILDAKKLKG
ncbi:MAG: electron transfer flavoprotein subunit alpha/FixB family protein [candidate division WOR-3 bacterium]|nr:MAG: electron transfer flavoprotein subunit alpha/FixB family protein [candidate division WOR-3 bacterium]